jgi:sortase (surface protein transpeptidase)
MLVAAAALSACGTGRAADPAASTPAARTATTVSAPDTARPGAIPALKDGPTGPAHPDPSTPAAAAVPIRVRIPAIGVDSRLQRLQIERDGSLQTPSKWQVAGWYAAGTRPGDIGPAVIAGHVDSTAGPAVFFHLGRLRPGDRVYVSRADASTVRFVVAGIREYPKRTFPTQAVYGPVAVPTLRLVTCTGDFEVSKRSYVDNLVVTAYEG